MPEYIYRAVTSKGQIVRNRVEDVSKNSLIKKLKNSDLLPISIVQVGYRGKKTKTSRKNIMDIDDIMKQANSTNIMQGRTTAKPSMKERVNLALSREEKITTRDIIIFTQNFYLLKRASFNNIHALSTIIDSTENLSLRGILQDILAGVEGRRLYVYNYGILFKYISIYICKYD